MRQIAFILLLLTFPGISYANRINITVPSSIKDGEKVPFFVDFNPALKSGEVAKILVDNSGKIAYQLEVYGDNEIAQLSGRIKNVSGVLKAEIEGGDQKVASLNGTRHPGPSAGSSSSTQCKKASKGKTYKLLCKNTMGANNYLEVVSISTNLGKINIGMTPYASSKPFLSVKSAKSVNYLSHKVFLSGNKTNHNFNLDKAMTKHAGNAKTRHTRTGAESSNQSSATTASNKNSTWPQRKKILDDLFNGRISQQEADKRLAELDNKGSTNNKQTGSNSGSNKSVDKGSTTSKSGSGNAKTFMHEFSCNDYTGTQKVEVMKFNPGIKVNGKECQKIHIDFSEAAACNRMMQAFGLQQSVQECLYKAGGQ